MALRRTLGIAIPLAAAAGVAVAVLPPRPLLEPFWWGRLISWSGDRGLAVAERDVEEALSRLRRQDLEARHGDSAMALARAGRRALRSADGLVTVLYEPPLTADSAARVLRDAERELELYPADERPGLPAIVVLYGDSARRGEDEGKWRTRRQFVRSRGDAAACVVELNLLPQAREGRRWRRLNRLPLGACALYARYGLPGRTDLRWLGIAVADVHDLPDAAPLSDALVQARQSRGPQAAPWEWRHATLPWLREGWFRMPPVWWKWSACLANGGPTCLGSGRPSRPFYWWWTRADPGRAVLARLLLDGGGRRFGALWRSDAPAEQALEAAYGKPAATLVRDAMLATWVPGPRGPRVTSRIAAAALGWLAVALGLAVVAGIRRRVRD